MCLEKQIAQYEALMRDFAQNGEMKLYEKYKQKVSECKQQLQTARQTQEEQSSTSFQT